MSEYLYKTWGARSSMPMYGMGDDQGISVKAYSGGAWASYQSPGTDQLLRALQQTMNKFPGISVAVNGVITPATAGWVQTIAHRFLYDSAGQRVNRTLSTQAELYPADLAGQISRAIGSGPDANVAGQAELVAKQAVSIANLLSELLGYLQWYNAKPKTKPKPPSTTTSSSGSGAPSYPTMPPSSEGGGVMAKLSQMGTGMKVALGAGAVVGLALVTGKLDKKGGRRSSSGRRSR